MYVVHIQKDNEERVYEVEASSRYAAAIHGLSSFIEEMLLPGKPYQYWGSNDLADELEVSVRRKP